MNYASDYPFWLGKETFRGGMAAPHNLGDGKESLKSHPGSRGKPTILCRYFILTWDDNNKKYKKKSSEQLAFQHKWRKSAGKQKEQEWRTHFKLQIPIKSQKIFQSLQGRWLGRCHLELQKSCRQWDKRMALKCGEIEQTSAPTSKYDKNSKIRKFTVIIKGKIR